MTINHKMGYSLAALAIILAVGMGIFRVKKSVKEEPALRPETAENKDKNEPGGDKIDAKEAVWVGTLKNSDNNKKGNLMLIASERVVYIRTSRDFSALVGKKVNVTYEGSLDSFVLGNITENLPR